LQRSIIRNTVQDDEMVTFYANILIASLISSFALQLRTTKFSRK